MIFGFLLAVCFDPFIWQGATTPRWALLAIALPILVYRQAPGPFNLSHLVGALFVTWAALTMLWSPNKYDATMSLLLLAIIAQAFSLGSRLRSLENTFVGLAIGIAVSGLILILSKGLEIKPWSVVATYPHGLFGNRNMLGETAALVGLGCLVYRRYWLLPLIAPALLWPPLAGGGVLAFGAGAFLWVWQRSWRVALLLACLISLIGVFTVDFAYKWGTLGERIELWRVTWTNSNWFGHGIGSLYTLFPYITQYWDITLRRPDHAHNEAIEFLFELGAVGFTLYAVFIALALEWAGRYLPILVGFLVISSLSFSWHIPTSAFLGALVIGHIARDGDDVRRVLADSRALLSRWYARAGAWRKVHGYGAG